MKKSTLTPHRAHPPPRNFVEIDPQRHGRKTGGELREDPALVLPLGVHVDVLVVPVDVDEPVAAPEQPHRLVLSVQVGLDFAVRELVMDVVKLEGHAGLHHLVQQRLASRLPVDVDVEVLAGGAGLGALDDSDTDNKLIGGEGVVEGVERRWR